MKVHPFADRFPLLEGEEFDQLVESISKNGLIHPIVVKGAILIDGRNRLRACEMAGVEPRSVQLPKGIRPEDYILSANIDRRHLSAGQRAMLFALANQEVKPGRRSDLLGTSLVSEEVAKLNISQSRISQARTVMHYAPEYIDQVVKGGKLDKAYEIALDRKSKEIENEKKMKELHESYPDLYVLVESGSLTLASAMVEKISREREAKAKHDLAVTNNRVKLLLEEIGPEVEFTIPPEKLTTNVSSKVERESTATEIQLASAKKQEAFLKLLIGIEKELTKMSGDSPDISGEDYWPEVTVIGVYSAGSRIIARMSQIMEAYKAMIGEEQQIRRVK